VEKAVITAVPKCNLVMDTSDFRPTSVTSLIFICSGKYAIRTYLTAAFSK